MKDWLEKNYKTLIIGAFLVPILTVAIVSISHVTKWYGISNPVTWAIYLSVGIEIAALSTLAAISANLGKKVYFPFAIVTLIQFIGNVYFAYSYIDITSKSFQDWVGLVSPIVEFMGVDPNDFSGHKRFLAFFAGGMLPIISLSFLHMLVKFTEEDKKKRSEINKDTIEPKEVIEAKEIVAEVSRVRLTEEELEELEKHLVKSKKTEHSLPDDEIQKEEWSDNVNDWDSTLNDGLEDEEFEWVKPTEPVVEDVQPNNTPQNESEMMLTTNEDIIKSIPPDNEPSDMDLKEEEIQPVIEEEEKFTTLEEIMSTLEPDTKDTPQEEPEFDGFVPEPFATPEEIEKHEEPEIQIMEEEKKKNC